MSCIRVHQASFNAGEVTPELLGRTDDVKYAQGLATCQNFICTPQGPVENRPGTEFVHATKYADKPSRLVAFNRGPTESMCLEFGEKYIRFHTQGMTLMSNGRPYEVTTPYTADDLADLTFSQSIDVITICHPRHPPQDLKRYGASDWRLGAVKLNHSFSAPTNVHASFNCMDEEGNIKNKTAFTLSYVVTACDANGDMESEASAVATVQGNLYINSAYARITWNTVSGAKVYKVYKSVGGLYGFIGQTEGTSIDDDNISPDMSVTPKRRDDAFGLTKAITSVVVNSQGSGYQGTRDIISVATSGTGKEDYDYPAKPVVLPMFFSTYKHETGWVEVVDEGGTGSGAVIEPIFYNPVGYGENYITGYKVVQAGKGYTKPKIQHKARAMINNKWRTYVHYEAYCTVSPEGGISLSVTDSTGTGAVLKPIVVDGRITSVTIVSGGQNYTSPTVHIHATNGSGASITASVGAGSSYPVTVTRFEQRRIFAGSHQWPQHIWMTRNGTEDDMSYRLPVQDDDRISVDMATTDGGSIRHIIATTQLLILTDGGEYRVTPINSDAITPTSMNIRPQSFVGASRVQPVLVNNTVLYPAARGGHIRELGYNYQAGGYVTGDLCLRATHLFDHKNVVSLAYQKAPYPVVWAVSSSGDLLGATYVPEQAVLGWHRHTTTLGAFESVCAVSEGDVDHVYVVVRRLVQGKYHRFIERMKDRSFPTLEDSFLVDSGVTIDVRGSTKYIKEVGGLAHLEGCTVSILADGAVLAQQKVKDGKVVLDREVQIAHVGLPIQAELMTLPVRIPTQDGTMGRGRKKSVNVVWLRVLNSSGVWAGPKDGELVENKNRQMELPGTPPALKNTELEIRIPKSIDTEGQVRISQSDPLPLTLLASTAEVDLMS